MKEGLPRECKVAKKFAHHPLEGAEGRERLAPTGQNSKQLATNWIRPAPDHRQSIAPAAIQIWLSFVKDFMGLRRHATPKTPASPCILAPLSTPVLPPPPTMTILSEFKEFAVKGNVVDLAVGVIIGAAFGKIVDSLVADIIMPVIGLVFGKLDFSNLYVVLGTVPAGVANTLAELKKAGVPVLAYGNFITIVVNFVILAFIIFMMVKQINRLRRTEEAAPPAPAAPPEDIVLLREIRDSLKRS